MVYVVLYAVNTVNPTMGTCVWQKSSTMPSETTFSISLDHVRHVKVNYNFIHVLKTDLLPWSPPHSGNIQQAIRLARNACRELDIKLAMTGNAAVGGATYN